MKLIFDISTKLAIEVVETEILSGLLGRDISVGEYLEERMRGGNRDLNFWNFVECFGSDTSQRVRVPRVR